MRVISSTSQDRLPSSGLLLLRVIVISVSIARCVQFLNGASLETIAVHVIAAGAALFLLLGLWTRVAGAVLAISELFVAFSRSYDPWLSILLASLGIVLAMLGPGSWSMDARRSGWKRIEIRRPSDPDAALPESGSSTTPKR